MSLATFLESLPADSGADVFVRGLRRLHVLSAQQFERSLSVEELQELLAIRQELRAHMATWLVKR